MWVDAIYDDDYAKKKERLPTEQRYMRCKRETKRKFEMLKIAESFEIKMKLY